MISIGIYGVSTKSGKAYLADFLSIGVKFYGYARPSKHGTQIVSTLRRQKGIYLERPPNNIGEESRFLSLNKDDIGHDINYLIDKCDVILITHPANFHEETVRRLKDAGLLGERPKPLILSPSRTLATPYIWRILGENYPVISFITCPYSCKSFELGATYIKRRKKSWIASVEGHVHKNILDDMKKIFPQMLVNGIPATTSLGNMGAILHPAAYLKNLQAIRTAEENGTLYSFYLEGIVKNYEVGRIIEVIDQIRLQIASSIGCSVFGLQGNHREEEWKNIMDKVAALDNPSPKNINQIRQQMAVCLEPIRDSVVSGQHWLHYTYGMERIPGEPFAEAIGRTQTFMNKSYPQERYIHEDVPTGLVPMESLAQRFGLPHETITRIIDLYQKATGIDARKKGRNLKDFNTLFLRQYLAGKLIDRGTNNE